MAQVLDYQGSPGRERRPIVELLALSAPMVAQQLSYTLMQFIDTWFLARVGYLEATAAASAGLFGFSIIGLGFGTLWVVNTLVSQAYGRRESAECGRYLWQGVWFALAFSVLLLPTLPFAGGLFLTFGHEPALARMEALYFKIVIGFAFLKLIGVAVAQFLLAIDRPRQVFLSTVCGVMANVVAAVGLIFGHFGLPRLELAGAAWAQNIGVAVETAMLIGFALAPSVRRAFHVADWRPRLAYMRTLLAVGLPAGVQLVADVLAWSIFSLIVINEVGTKAMAANQFMMRYMVVSFMPAFGISTAVTALVGRYIGMGRPEVGVQRTHLAFSLTAAYMLTCGLVFFLGRNVLMRVFTDDPEIQRIGAMLLVFAAVYQFFDALYIVYNGALRGAGDTFAPAVATAALCWGVTVTGGHLLARYLPQWGVAGPWGAATVYGIILGLYIFARFRRGAWKSIRLDPARQVPPTGPPLPGMALPGEPIP